MDRREFLTKAALLAALVGGPVTVTSCGDDDPATPGGNGDVTGTAIGSDHTHTGVITKAQLDAGVAVTITFTGSGHTHGLPLTDTQVMQIAQGTRVWGTALGQMLLSIWHIVLILSHSWDLWQQWLLAFSLIGIWQWLLMDMYWDVYISPEHDSPHSIMIKTLATHIPNVTLCLIFLAIFNNS